MKEKMRREGITDEKVIRQRMYTDGLKREEKKWQLIREKQERQKQAELDECSFAPKLTPPHPSRHKDR